MGNFCSLDDCKQKRKVPFVFFKRQETSSFLTYEKDEDSSSLNSNFGVDEDEWFDALQEHSNSEEEGEGVEEEETFHVSPSELNILKEDLKTTFPEDYNYMRDDYILSVASKPYSKDMSRRRPLEYSKKKLFDVMNWRKEKQVPQLSHLVTLANMSETEALAFTSSAKTIARAKAMVTSLNMGSIYWHGLTKTGQPILWFRASRLPWFPNVDGQVDTLAMLADIGIQDGMPKGITDFVVMCHFDGSPPPHPTFAYRMVDGLTKGYPDRMGKLVGAPVSSIVMAFDNLTRPIMPARVAQKLSLLSIELCKERLANLLLNGEDDLPTFFGGSNKDHDKYYPEQKYAPNRGKGFLTFDFYGCKARLKKQKRSFEEREQ